MAIRSVILIKKLSSIVVRPIPPKKSSIFFIFHSGQTIFLYIVLCLLHPPAHTHPAQINYGRLLNTLPKQMIQFTVTSHTSTLHPLICLPSSGDIVMIEMLTGKILRRLQGHFGQVNCLVSHPVEQVRDVRTIYHYYTACSFVTICFVVFL